MNYLEYFHQEMVRLHEESTDFYGADPVVDIQIAYEEASEDHVPAKYRLSGLDQIKQERFAREEDISIQNEKMQAQAIARKAEEEANPRIVDVYVGGLPYKVRREDNGRLRFVKNPNHFLVKRLSPVFGGEGDEDPNNMGIAFAKGEISLRDYAEMNIGMGYSLDGFEELHNFEDLEVRCDIPQLCREGRHFTPADDKVRATAP